jgi:acyl transferase domain-containing protein
VWETAVSSSPDRPYHLLTLSAKDETALGQLAQRYTDFLATRPDANLADIAYTANVGRATLPQRLALVAEDVAQAQEKLAAFAGSERVAGLVNGRQASTDRPKIAFFFTGQGAQYTGMGRQLYETQPVFHKALDQCDAILRDYLDVPLLDVIFGESARYQGATEKSPISNLQSLIDHTAYTQPALFAIEYALARLWQSWGVEPTAVMGHSVGEYAAAVVAGVFSLEDGLKLIANRGRLMGALPADGAMAAVFADATTVEQAIVGYEDDVSIAALNGPTNVVISGRETAVSAILATLTEQGVKSRSLLVSHAFHSPLMEPMLDEFERVAATIEFAPPRLRLISNVTGLIARRDTVANAAY